MQGNFSYYNPTKLYFTLIALVTMQSIFAADRLSALPRPILGGELSNSAATSVADIDEVMPRMKALGLNTVLVPAYWELMEPREQSQTKEQREQCDARIDTAESRLSSRNSNCFGYPEREQARKSSRGHVAKR